MIRTRLPRLFSRLLSLAIIAVLLTATTLVVPIGVEAAVFDRNRIIDDSIFDNSGTMNTGQIDAFLNGFSNSCISMNSGFQAIKPIGYNPSQGFQYGDYTSAGEVIATAAGIYGINPQVLIVTLEKEQGLVRGQNNFAGYCNNGNSHKYAAAAGYGCPDSGSSQGYSNVNIYRRHGVTNTSVSSTCVNTSAKVGFSQQVIRAAWLLKFGQQRSKGNLNWAVIGGSWDNSDDLRSCYGGPMTQGNRRTCPNGTTVYYDGFKTIDNTAVYMTNGATAALYWYTPHFHGNQNFSSLFNEWFGATYASQLANSLYVRTAWAGGCNIHAYDSGYVGRLYNPETEDYFYTTNHVEACTAVKFGYIWDGIVMRNIVSTLPGAVPVYRIVNPGRHLFTSSLALRDQYINNQGYQDEGIAFYAYNSAVAGTIPAYCMVNGMVVVYTSAGGEKQLIEQSMGFANAGVAFYTPEMSNTTPVYRLNRGPHRLYTTNANEKDAAKSIYNFNEELHTFMAETAPDINTTPVYRMSAPDRHFYTTSRVERDNAIMYYGYFSEGIEFYGVDSAVGGAKTVYRLTDINGHRVFTPDAPEKDNAVSIYGYTSEGTGWHGL